MRSGAVMGVTAICTAGALTITAMAGAGETLVISFSSVGQDPGRPPAPEFVGTATDQGRPALFVMDAARSWAQSAGHMDHLGAAIDRVRARQNITRIVAMGQSMGGYAALFAAARLPIDLVLAFGPQSSLAGEARWQPWAKGVILPPLGPPGPRQRWVVMHGLVDDVEQAQGFAPAPGLDHILFPDLTHSALCPHLKARGVLKGLLESAISGDRRRMLRIAGGAGGRIRARLGG